MNPEQQRKILQELDSSGFLNQMRASFRSQVFENLIQSDKSILPYSSLPKELDSDIGHIACALIVDFMNQFALNHTRKIMKTEAFIDDQPESLGHLEESLGIHSEKKNPLLFTIVAQMFGEDDEEISEDIHADSDLSSDDRKDGLVESAGTSHGPDQSVTSLAMEEFDYVEIIKKRD